MFSIEKCRAICKSNVMVIPDFSCYNIFIINLILTIAFMEEMIMCTTSSISDEQLNNVTGGYVEDGIGYDTYGKEIICPYCNESDKSIIERKMSDNILEPGNYYCKKCKRFFMVKP